MSKKLINGSPPGHIVDAASRSGKSADVGQAVSNLLEAEQEEKNIRIKKIMDDAARLLEAEEVKYFIGVLDREKENPNQGRAFVQSDVSGDDMIHILDMALPTRQDAVNLGVYVGTLIKAHQNKK